MVLKELKHGMKFAADTAIKCSPVSKAEVKRKLGYLVKAGKISSKELQSLASELAQVSKKHHERVKGMVKKEVKKALAKKGISVKVKITKKKATKKKATKKKTVKKNFAKNKRSTKSKARK